MEYILNKIDTDLRQKINDAAKEGLIHGTKNIEINKDKQKEKKDYNPERYDNHKKIIVDAVKAEKIEIDATNENVEYDEASKGVYLDTKK
ncbi:hypothetical protein JK636_20050 [Clostridium sp. YIM B02515]|uniref:Uncharacterized protein n=1 Tax=Clostridium rhizosphaerae TaxID=2803861 RepID=A0ABS1TFZ8_9CLOT|nr:hypothetical protein [Clostridium rhizosphaerae]MBL4938007.1 hypothetical protein [Clostridium rhizosphaerae]